jgi:hypothetical protein
MVVAAVGSASFQWWGNGTLTHFFNFIFNKKI